MVSRNSFFSKTLFWKTVTRFWPLWAAYLAAWTLSFPVVLFGELDSGVNGRDLFSFVYDQAGPVGIVFSAIVAIMAAMAIFSHLYTPRAAGGFAVLPIRREGVYLSHFTAALACLSAANVLVFLMAALVELAFGCLTPGPLFTWLAAVTMLNIFFLGFASFCAQLTGSILVLPAVYAVLNFVAVVVESIGRSMLELIVFGMSNTHLRFTELSPAVYLFQNCGSMTEW